VLDSRTARLIGKIYEGVEDPATWRGAIREFLDVSGGRVAFIGVIDAASNDLPFTDMVGPETSALDDAMRLHRELIPIDPGLPYAVQRPGGGNFRFSATGPALTAAPGDWRDFIRHDFGSGDYHSRFSAAEDGVSLVLALHVPTDQPRLTHEQEALHGMVFSHMERAARLAYRAPDLELASTACLVVDHQARVMKANAAAEAILGAGDGLATHCGVLGASSPTADRALRRAVREVCGCLRSGAAGRALAAPRPSGRPDLLLRLRPLPLDFSSIEKAFYRCLIEIVEPGAAPAPLDPEVLAALFDLTPREAELASLFSADCSDLPTAAAALEVSYETARAHLRAVFDKCGVGNQVELVRLLARLG